jgi:endonuclease/exonuclease/phosphatase family metal-dependent hydrolase
MRRLIRYSLVILLPIAFVIGLIYNVSWHPARHERMAVSCNIKDAPPPQLAPSQTLNVMTWNIQHLAGKRYVFWYDLPDGSGPDERPTPEDLAYNLDEVARIIRDEQPDIVLLQDVDDGAKNTDYVNQQALLQARVTDLFPCSTEAFYWKSDFVPNRHIYGSVGTKLTTLSRYRIDKAERLQLPSPDRNIISRQFQPRHAMLVSYLPVGDGGQLAVVNTQLTEPSPEDDTPQRQVDAIAQRLGEFESTGTPWLIGGDFNLLAKGQYARLPDELSSQYAPDSQLKTLWEKFPMIPSHEETRGEDRRAWYTRFPNDPRVSGPDRTLDYFFYSPKLQRLEARVRQQDTLLISDHMPVIARFTLTGTPPVSEATP